jgi:type I restriction enzyme M protein
MSNTGLVQLLGFTPKENTSGIFHKKYADGYAIEVDFENGKINYGDLIKSESATTQNMSQAENWVVLECVNRLLEKGYQPKNITLEKIYPSGHGTSGRLDILVVRDDGTAYLMIECKTYGTEFDKEFNRLNKDGGQLFTYFQQDKNAAILMLYASHLKGSEIVYCNEIIKIEDDYRQTGNVKDFYERWNKLPKNNGVFDAWVNPYDFQSKALTPKGLKDIKQEDSSFIFNQFLEILRHNVVSDKPNAFNKIFTLFLCKIYDEKATKPNDELSFQWLEGKDDHISFQKRLTDLYKKGMKEFLEKEVTDLSDSEFESKFQGVDVSIKKQFLDQLTEIRLKKNNEFAIKEVFDDDSFQENAKVVKEVIELLQGFKIRYTKKQQYLSDFFELLLTTGLKQESGQFFTPVPIAQFIIKSIPIDRLVHEKLGKGETNNLLPTIIDYAAGSGHFITESMHEVQRIIDHLNPNEFIDATARKLNTWKQDHFDWALQYVYGIEKDYRLVKVGKVGCYLHGDGLAKIIHSDGLGNFTQTPEFKDLLKKTDKDFPQDNKQFDIVVSNPPYSVSAFKNNARKYYTEADFEIYDKLTDQSSEIECLFIERTKQLLKDGGMAGVILPSSILSNTGIYTKAREIILQNFDIVAIAELGGNTFMATNTNTVILFLRRRNNYDSINIRSSVTKAVADVKDVTINGIEKPFSKYVAHVWEGVSFDDYATLLRKQPNDTIKHHEIYQEYLKKINAKDDAERWNKIIELETEKLFYFILAYKQKIVLVKSGEKQEEKQFLGYEFSNRRGSEGIHPIQRGKAIDDCTQLFDADVFDNPEKASTYVYHAFSGDFKSPINEKLAKHIFRVDLVELFTFDRVDFEKNISLAVKKKIKIESKWDLYKLSQLADIVRGASPRPIKKYITKDDNGVNWIKIGDVSPESKYITKTKEKITAEGALKSRMVNNGDFIVSNSMSFGRPYILEISGCIHDGWLLLTNFSKDLDKNYLYTILSNKIAQEQFHNAASGGTSVDNLNIEKASCIRVPLPPKNIQEKIVTEIEVLEAKETEAKREIDELKSRISQEANTTFQLYKTQKLGQVCESPIYGANEKAINGDPDSDYRYIRITDINDGGSLNNDWKTAESIEGKYTLREGDFLFARSGATAGKTFLYTSKYGKAIYAGYLIKFETKKEVLLPGFLNFILKGSEYQNWVLNMRKGAAQPNINAQQYSSFQIPLPTIEEQQKIVTQITEIENKIAVLESELITLPQQKESILNKYL